MRRVSAVGLGLLVVLALSALITSTSAYATGEYGQCRELTKETNPKTNHGKYTEASCLVLYSKKGKIEAKGNFEWFPGAPPRCVGVKKGKYKDAACTEEDVVKGNPKGKFERTPCAEAGNCGHYTEVSGPAVLYLEAYINFTVTCSGAGIGEGTITGSKSSTGTLLLTGCETEGCVEPCSPIMKGPATSPGEPAGTIKISGISTLYGEGEITKGCVRTAEGEYSDSKCESLQPLGLGYERIHYKLNENQVWDCLESSEGEPYLTEIESIGARARASGLACSLVSGVGVMGTGNIRLDFTNDEGEQQDLVSEISKDGGASWGEPNRRLGVDEDSSVQVTTDQPVEIKD